MNPPSSLATLHAVNEILAQFRLSVVMRNRREDESPETCITWTDELFHIILTCEGIHANLFTPASTGFDSVQIELRLLANWQALDAWSVFGPGEAPDHWNWWAGLCDHQRLAHKPQEFDNCGRVRWTIPMYGLANFDRIKILEESIRNNIPADKR